MQGIEKFSDALRLYATNNILVVVFLITVLYILKKSNQKQRKYLVTIAIMAVLLLFNGVTFAVVKWLGEDTTYYRFFWICPVVLASAYLVVELLFEVAAKGWQKICLLLVFSAMLLGNYGQSFNGWSNIPSNVYQIDDDIVQLGDLLAELTDDERTVLLAEDDIASHIREYNANIISNPDGFYYLDDIINEGNINYIARNVMMYMDFNMAEYIAVEKEKIGTNRLFLSIGCEEAGETDHYKLYYYDSELLSREWELFDKVMEEKQIYVNSEYIAIPGLKEQKDYLYVTDIWTDVTQEQRQAVIDLANELQVEALIINSVKANHNLTTEFLEEQLKNLEVPYIYNNQGIQMLEEEKYSIVCMTTENMQKETGNLGKYLALGVEVVLILDNKISETSCTEEILAEDSPVLQLISGNGGWHKEMLNERILSYSAMGVNEYSEHGFVTLLRVKGLEKE